MSPSENWVGTWEKETPQSVSATCGWCGKGVEMLRVSKSVEFGRTEFHMGPETVRVGALYVCPRDECHRPSLVVIEFLDQYGEAWAHKVVGQLPRGRAQELDGLPEAIESVRQEAWRCYYGGDYRAAVVIGRAAVQRAVRTLGGMGRDLHAEVEALHARAVVSGELKDWAHEVRIAAREAAHPEEIGDVTQEEAKASLQWADAFLGYAVALPERRRRQRGNET